jgi:hypothetical protein
MTSLPKREDVPDPIDMGPRFHAITTTFWNWIFNDVLHDPRGVRREGHWGAEPVAVLAECGGVHYQWSNTGGLSWLTLWTRDGTHRRTRTAVTASTRPPFSLLTRCWFDLCLDANLINEDEWSGVCAQLERFKTWERPEYGDCW